MQHSDTDTTGYDRPVESLGNTYSGFVALALLAMFALALVSSELESAGDEVAAPVATVIAGQ